MCIYLLLHYSQSVAQHNNFMKENIYRYFFSLLHFICRLQKHCTAFLRSPRGTISDASLHSLKIFSSDLSDIVWRGYVYLELMKIQKILKHPAALIQKENYDYLICLNLKMFIKTDLNESD